MPFIGRFQIGTMKVSKTLVDFNFLNMKAFIEI